MMNVVEYYSDLLQWQQEQSLYVSKLEILVSVEIRIDLMAEGIVAAAVDEAAAAAATTTTATIKLNTSYCYYYFYYY